MKKKVYIIANNTRHYDYFVNRLRDRVVLDQRPIYVSTGDDLRARNNIIVVVLEGWSGTSRHWASLASINEAIDRIKYEPGYESATLIETDDSDEGVDKVVEEINKI